MTHRMTIWSTFVLSTFVLAGHSDDVRRAFAAEPVTSKAASSEPVGPSDIRRILFLGNSITLHGPKEDIGWTGNWGMAASSAEKDYVHLVTGAIGRHTGKNPEIQVKNIADFERNFSSYDVPKQMKEALAFDADLVVLAIGENVPALTTEDAQQQFKAGVANILRELLAKRRPLIVVRSCFWADADKDRKLREACEEANCIFVDAGPLGQNPVNYARSERAIAHAGVAAHPGDRGMKALADLIIAAVIKAPSEN